MNGKLKTLVKLLDDEDLKTSAQAMSEILSKERLAWRVIARLQESNNETLRRKAHQMQFVASSRARRKKLASRMAQKNVNILKGLIELHLQWFDEDSEEYVENEWNRFKNIALNWDADNIENLSEMMTGLSMEASSFDEIDCADYCVGEIVASGKGIDFMLCAIARILSREQGWEPSIIATDSGFCIYDEKRQEGLFPTKAWTRAKCKIDDSIKRWTDSMILNLATTSMFYCSILNGQLRYSYMLGSCIAQSMGEESISKILPYPLGEKDPPK